MMTLQWLFHHPASLQHFLGSTEIWVVNLVGLTGPRSQVINDKKRKGLKSFIWSWNIGFRQHYPTPMAHNGSLIGNNIIVWPCKEPQQGLSGQYLYIIIHTYWQLACKVTVPGPLEAQNMVTFLSKLIWDHSGRYCLLNAIDVKASNTEPASEKRHHVSISSSQVTWDVA